MVGRSEYKLNAPIAPEEIAPWPPVSDPRKEAGDAKSAKGSSNSGERLQSLDAYRGLAMLLMASGAFGLARVLARKDVYHHFDDTQAAGWWHWLCRMGAYHFEHAPWVGCALWDLIQPSFMFMVGVSLPFSIAARKEKGTSTLARAWHALVRAVVLVALGVFLRSARQPETNFTFEDVLSQIGLGYFFLYLLHNRGLWIQLIAVAAILGGDWYFFYKHPVPEAGFDYSTVGVPPDWYNPQVPRLEPGDPDYVKPEWKFQTGLAAHWEMNTNAAAWYDNEVLLKRFPYSTAWSPERPYNAGGYQTLNFIPSLATMIFGLMAGELLRGRLSGNLKALRLLWAGLACLVLGLACDSQMWPFLASDRFVICPIVKRIWTPSWALFSSAWTFWTLAFFYYVMDVRKFRFWAFPLIVVGMNSITMYVMAGLMKGWVSQQIKIHVGSAARHLWDKNLFDDATMSGSLALQASTLFALWLICYLMYRQRLFVRI